MGKYRDWLHHQEVGRTLRDDLARQMRARARVLARAPRGGAATALGADNPIVAALQAWLGASPQVAAGSSLPYAAPEAFDPVAVDSKQGEELSELVVQQLMVELQDSSADPLAVLHELTQSVYGPAEGNLPFQPPQLDVLPGAVVNIRNDMQTQPRPAVPWWLQNEAAAGDSAADAMVQGTEAEVPSASPEDMAEPEDMERRDAQA
jgi:hypothetical protein